MPAIRFKDKNGKCFILYCNVASYGAPDLSDPATARTIDATVASCNRCSNGITLTLVEGTFTWTFDVNGRTGSCIQCGQCCSHLASTCTNGASCGYSKIIGLYHACPHLVKLGPGIGKKNGTECDIYNRLLYEGYKSCVSFPSEAFEIVNRPMCGFTF